MPWMRPREILGKRSLYVDFAAEKLTTGSEEARYCYATIQTVNLVLPLYNCNPEGNLRNNLQV